MKRDTLKKKGILVGMIIIIFGVSIFITTQPKEQLSQSAPIAEQENITTLNTIAMYQENDSGTYDEITNFDKEATAADVILAGKSIASSRSSSITGILIGDVTRDSSTLYTTEDDWGTSYYFAGDTEENWVRFGGYYWRIIRINGNGSIRMIYAGEDTGSVTDANRTGTTTQISLDGSTTGYAFNTETEYVGLRFTQGSQHGNTENSDILDTMNTWYITNISSLDQAHVDTSTWFCSDRVPYSNIDGTTTSWVSTGSYVYYAARIRLETNKAPTLQCSTSSDRLTTPNGVGLITADEVAMAGGVWGTANQSYYLHTGQHYWTMSPYYYGGAGMIIIASTGYIAWSRVNVTATIGVRPVINLKADTTVTGMEQLLIHL